jgi:hypothetical protein
MMFKRPITFTISSLIRAGFAYISNQEGVILNAETIR